MNCRGADIFTLTKNGKTTVHCQNHSSCSPQFPNTYTALKEDMMQKLFQNLLLALKRDIFKKKNQSSLFIFVCAAFGFSLHFAQWPRERENLVELQIFLQIKSKGMSALRTCKRMDYSTIDILPELYYTNSNISFTKLDVITKTPILSSISPHPSWCDGVCVCVSMLPHVCRWRHMYLCWLSAQHRVIRVSSNTKNREEASKLASSLLLQGTGGQGQINISCVFSYL